MSCAYRFHRYRSSVTAHPPSVSWQPPTGHAQHPIPLRPPVAYPHRQAVLATADDAPIPVRLVQYLWAQWQVSPPSDRESVTRLTRFIGALMLSPRWHWDVTVLRDQSPPDSQGSLVSSRDGRWTIGIPIAMLRDLWRWMLDNIDERASVLRRWAIDPALWQELRTHRLAHGPRLREREWYPLYGYLSPVLLPDIAHTAHDLLSSADPDDQQMALTMLTRWMASDDHATRDLAAQMLRAWLNQQAAASSTNYRRRLQDYRRRLQAITMLSSSDDPTVVSEHLYHLLRTARNRITPDDVRTIIDLLHGCGAGRSLAMNRWMSLMKAMVRDHPSDAVVRAVLDRLPTIMPPDRPADRVRWAATLWTLLTDSTRSDARRQMIAMALTKMMQEPMVAAQVHAQLCTEPSLHQTLPAPICDTLLKGLIQTAHTDAVLRMIAQEIRQNPNASARFDPIVAAGWGHGQDHRILQFIDSIPGPHWRTVLEMGITTSVGAAVCDRIQAWFSRDQAMAMIVDHIRAREERGDWPLAPLPAYLIPWVGGAARVCPNRLRSTTIRRLWLADPVRAWDVTQTMLGSRSSQRKVIDAMDTGWGVGYDAAMTTILRSIILERQDDRDGIETIETGIATAVAGIGRADPFLIESLLTHLATTGNETVRRQLISALRHGWGRGQDDLVARVLATIADQTVSERVWDRCSGTLIRAWDYQPRDVVVSLIDRLLTHAMNGLVNEKTFEKWFGMVSMAEAAIAAFAPLWTHLPTAHMIERIAHHVAHLHAHAHTIGTYSRDTLVSAWAALVTASAARLSASDIHAVLAPLWNLSPERCLDGVKQGVRR